MNDQLAECESLANEIKQLQMAKLFVENAKLQKSK